MLSNRYVKIILFIIAPSLTTTMSCNKYLDKKPAMAYYIPQTAQDLQAILDNNILVNFQSGTTYIELIADDYNVNYDNWNNSVYTEKDNYIWGENAQSPDTYSLPYQMSVFYSNVVLDQLLKVNRENNVEQFNNIEGSALFYRSFAFHYLSQLYCLPFKETSQSDKGIVLKLTGAVDVVVKRATVAQTYEQIISDLKKSVDLLPTQPLSKMRPGKSAALALLARVYLSMSDYSNALTYAQRALDISDILLDFNDLQPFASPILLAFDSNPELLFFNVLRGDNLTGEYAARIDSVLYSSYGENDIRKYAFFSENQGVDAGTYKFNGSYYSDYGPSVSNGPTTGELYLIKAECLARDGQLNEAVQVLNNLLRKRYRIGHFIDHLAGSREETLTLILNERRKELVFRGQRWSDLRRLNLEGQNIALKRVFENDVYVLPPNDPRFTLLIPDQEILRAAIEQNDR